MLRSEHSVVRFDSHRQTVHPDRLIRGRDADYLAAASVMLRRYRDGIGKPRQTLHQEVENLLSRLSGCPPRRIAAFCKLLDDLGEFQSDKRAAVELRKRVFSLAAPLHPIVDRSEGMFEQTVAQARAVISKELGRSWEEIDSLLFSDVLELQTLRQFNSAIEPAELLSLYNVAQTQAAMYRATQVRIDAGSDFKTIVRQIKLAGLMHTISRPAHLRGGYRFDLNGPQSALRETTRYGVRFAKLLPKLLTGRQWQLTAEVLTANRRRFQLRLSSDDGLRSPLEPDSEFDSQLEREILDHWNADPVAGWTMTRESELLQEGQKVLTPDFVLRHQSSGQKIYLEVVGYWTPEYLAQKCNRLRQFLDYAQGSWLLMFDKAGAAAKRQALADLSLPTIIFDKRKPPSDWIAAFL